MSSRAIQKTLPLLLLALCVCNSPAQETCSQPSPPSLEAIFPSSETTESRALLSTNWNLGLTVGSGFGEKFLGSSESHCLAVAALHVGKSLASERPFLRRVELAAEFWSGAQYHPDTAYVIGLTPILRYRLLPDSRCTPFLDAGAGITATDIGHPDLSTTFEFNLQAGLGLEWRWRRQTSIVLQTRYMHLSNARIDTPNLGVNTILFGGGMIWCF